MPDPNPVGAAPPAEAAVKARPARRRRIPPTVLAFFTGAVCSLIVIARVAMPSAGAAGSAKADVAASHTAVASTPPPATAVQRPRESEAVPVWVRNEERGWRSARPGVRFELAADHDVPVWNKRVRPVLTVRCVSGTTEVFVTTHSASSFERDAGLHTVRLSFNDGTDVGEQWQDSTNHEALFAPDGPAIARQIAQARKMSFRFTPFNASSVRVDFSVDGFDEHLVSAAKACAQS